MRGVLFRLVAKRHINFMLFHIKHTTRYTYSRTVYCEPFTIRLRPREDTAQRLVRHRLTIDPAPVGMSELLDVEGNSATHCWFNEPTCSLTIAVSSVVETKRANPFDFLLESAAVELPLRYRAEICPALANYRTPALPNGAVSELAQRMLTDAKRQTVPFLTMLADWIARSCEKVVRADGDPLPAETTLAQKGGSCRDLAVLFNEACRNVGLAARFVSGYQAHSEGDGQRHLHAWSEVFLPGAGWRGIDPGQGLYVSDQHVAVATGLHPVAAAPTVGTFRGTDATSTMDTQVVIRVA